MEKVKNQTEEKVKEPSMYKVIFLNDDYTSIEFVVSILVSIFAKTASQAEALAYKIHKKGRYEVGTYSYDVASTKATETMLTAKKNGYPLKVEVKEA